MTNPEPAVVPLVIYRNGERVVIGEAKIQHIPGKGLEVVGTVNSDANEEARAFLEARTKDNAEFSMSFHPGEEIEIMAPEPHIKRFDLAPFMEGIIPAVELTAGWKEYFDSLPKGSLGLEGGRIPGTPGIYDGQTKVVVSRDDLMASEFPAGFQDQIVRDLMAANPGIKYPEITIVDAAFDQNNYTIEVSEGPGPING